MQDDKELDQFSRTAAENYELEREPGSWALLQKRLDKELPQNKKRRRYILFILLFLLVGSGLWIAYSNNTTQRQPTVASSNPNQQHPNVANKEQINNELQNSQPLGTQQHVGTGQHKPEINDSKVTRLETLEGGVIQKGHIRENRNRVDISQGESKYSSSRLFQNNQIESIEDQKEPVENIIDPHPVNDNQIIPYDHLADVLVKSPSLLNKSQDVSQTPKSRELKNKASKWEFGILYAPDISTIKFTNTQKPGKNIGLTVAYKFSDKFSIQTGAIYTTKNYKLRGSDYHPPKGYWTNYVDLLSVSGYCNMWDIPLNLRYNFLQHKKSKFFVTTGLSTYLMNKEDYNYLYYMNGSPVNWEKTYIGQYNYVLSVLSLSAGIEKNLNKNFSIQAEPFFKQALTGVGFGNIKLNTTGIYFTLKYSPSVVKHTPHP